MPSAASPPSPATRRRSGRGCHDRPPTARRRAPGGRAAAHARARRPRPPNVRRLCTRLVPGQRDVLLLHLVGVLTGGRGRDRCRQVAGGGEGPAAPRPRGDPKDSRTGGRTPVSDFGDDGDEMLRRHHLDDATIDRIQSGRPVDRHDGLVSFLEDARSAAVGAGPAVGAVVGDAVRRGHLRREGRPVGDGSEQRPRAWASGGRTTGQPCPMRPRAARRRRTAASSGGRRRPTPRRRRSRRRARVSS